MRKSREKARRIRLARLCAFAALLTFLATPLRGSHRGSVGVSGVYTPYHLTAGGGERVILNYVALLQEVTGSDVHLIVTVRNICQLKLCVKELATKMQVSNIKWDNLHVKTVSEMYRTYDIWFAMGNSLLPEVVARGTFSIYHCQFPFDGASEKTDRRALSRLETYDVVYLNSRYTESWYHKFLDDTRRRLARTQHFDKISVSVSLPHIVHFAPPFDLLTSQDTTKSKVRHIVVVGRVFQGTQSKRHIVAIRAFARLKQSKQMTWSERSDLRLSLVGHVATGHEAFANELAREAARVRGITVHFNANSDVLREVVLKADVVWSLTGLDNYDPADAEHFGIALLECMSAGVIPIVASVGGPLEILDGFPGSLGVTSIDEVVAQTLSLIKSSPQHLAKLSTQAQGRARELSTQFNERSRWMLSVFGREIDHNILSQWLTLYASVRQYRQEYTLLPSSSPRRCPPIDDDLYAIVYMDTKYDLALRSNIFRLKEQLGEKWRVHIWLPRENLPTITHSLEGIPCVVYHFIEAESFDPRVNGTYQALWKSDYFLSSLGRSMSKILNFQPDVWFPPRSSFRRHWLKYDYIGAPWCHEGNWGYEAPAERPPDAVNMLHDTRQIPWDVRVGNGGVSLRSVAPMIMGLKMFKDDSPVQENEDVFFILAMKKLNCNTPSLSVAAKFSLEILCPDIKVHRGTRKYFAHISRYARTPTTFVPFAIHKPFEILHQLNHGPSCCGASLLRMFTETFF